MTNRFIVGLTGGIASGKTTVSQHFEALGITVVDADIIAKQILAPGKPLLRNIQQVFGAHLVYFNSDTQLDTLDRSALRSLIFQDQEKKQQLDTIMHPAIRQQIIQQLQDIGSPYGILSAPLLIENDLTPLCHRLLIVDIPEHEQIRRASFRDHVSQEQIEAIMAAQCSREKRLSLADDVLDNTLAKDTLAERILQLHELYLQQARVLHLSQPHIIG